MSPLNDFGDDLVEETLTEAAECFFGKRKKLDHKIEIFNANVASLRRKENTVINSVSFLDYLLLNGQATNDFFNAIGSNANAYQHLSSSFVRALPGQMPKGYRLRSKYANLVTWAYAKLESVSREYMHGPVTLSDTNTCEDEPPIYYHLVREIHTLINQEISDLNQLQSPTATLQFSKKFNTDLMEKECILGGTSTSAECNMDNKMRYQTIPLDRLGLKTYPTLPAVTDVHKKIRQFCKKLCVQNTAEIKRILNEIETRIKTANDQLPSL